MAGIAYKLFSDKPELNQIIYDIGIVDSDDELVYSSESLDDS